MPKNYPSKIRTPLALIAAVCVLGACSGTPQTSSSSPPQQNTSAGNDPGRYGSIIGGNESSGINLSRLLNPSDGGTSALPVNAILWRASLDTISVLPLDSVDTFGGTIITEWYAHPDDNSKRIKIAIFITDQELRSDAVKVQAYLQERPQGVFEWQDKGRDPELATRIEDLILTRAREIRATALSESN